MVFDVEIKISQNDFEDMVTEALSKEFKAQLPAGITSWDFSMPVEGYTVKVYGEVDNVPD